VYTRKRYDVWSMAYYLKGDEKVKGGGQSVVFDCGDGSGGDDGRREGNPGGPAEDSEGGLEDEVGGGRPSEQVGEGAEDDGERGMAVAGADEEVESGGDDEEGDNGAATREGTGDGPEEQRDTDTNEQQSIPELPPAKESEDQAPAQAEVTGEDTRAKGIQPDNGSGGGGGDDDDDDSDDDDEDDGPEPEDPPLRPSPSPSPPALTPYKPLLDQLDIQTALHSSYTTLAQANRAALATFLDLARPKNMAMEDHHHYRYFVEPDATARFEAGGFGASTCAEPARIEWDPPAKKYRWPFVRLVVEVAASELRGPVEIGDMVVEGPKGGGDGEGVGIGVGGGGRGGQRVGRANQAVVSSRTVDDARSKPAAALPSPAEEESEEDVSEEE
jgi:hypothetical protein